MSWTLMTMTIAIPRMLTLLDLKSVAACIQKRCFLPKSPPTMTLSEAYTNFLAHRMQLIQKDYISSLRELYSVSQPIAKALNIIGAATQNYQRRTSATPSNSLAYWPVQAPEHLKTSLTPGYVQGSEVAHFVMPAMR